MQAASTLDTSPRTDSLPPMQAADIMPDTATHQHER